MRRWDPTDMVYLRPWGKFGERGYNNARIKMNGQEFELRAVSQWYSKKSFFYWAEKDGKECSRKFCKLSPLLRFLNRTFPEEKNDKQKS